MRSGSTRSFPSPSIQTFTLISFLRRAKKDGVLPFTTPVKTTDNRVINEVCVPKDTRIIISLRQCNRNPEIWGPDAEEWKPERWLAPLPETVAKARVPGAYANL